MTPVTILGVLLGLPTCFYLPGVFLERAAFGVYRPVRGLELHVMRVVVSVLVCGWIGFLLAELGVWSLPAVLAGLVLVAAPPFVYQSRHGGRPSPVGPRQEAHALGAPLARAMFLRLGVADWSLLLVGLVFAVLIARPFEVVRGGLDAGVYALTGYAIAHTGGIVLHDPLVAEIGRRAEAGDPGAPHAMSNFLGVQDPYRNVATRLRAAGFYLSPDDWNTGRIVPQFFHLWPVWIATGVALGGPYYGLLTTGAWGLLGVLLLGMLGRRIAHPAVGVTAAAFLALNSVQVWFSRMPLSEALTQGLTLAGLWAYTHFADQPRGRDGIWWGAITGIAFGELAITRIDFFWAVGPALLWLLYVAVTRRWQAGHTALCIAMCTLLAHAALHVIFIARAYFFGTAYSPLGQVSALVEWLTLFFVTPKMRVQLLGRPYSALRHAWRLPLELGILLTLIVILVALWRRPWLLHAGERWLSQYRARVLSALATGLALLAFYAYVVRPQIVNAEVLHAPVSVASRARLAGYVGAPIAVPAGMKATIANDQANFARFGWYVSPLGILLGTAGGVLLWRCGLTRRSWLFLLIATAYTLFYVHALYGTADATYIYILRRYVPMVYPAWSLVMAYGIWWIGQGRRLRNLRRLVAVTSAILLAVFFVFTGRGVYAHVEYGGAIDQFRELASAVGPRDVVLVRGGGADVSVRDAPDIVAGPLTYLFNRNALTFKGTNPINVADALADQIRRWVAEGRGVYVLLSASGGDWRFPGWVAVPGLDWTWTYQEFQQLRDQKPNAAGPGSITFRLYRLYPAAGTAARLTSAGPADTIAQVSGFHRAERDGSMFFAWTSGQAILRLDAPAGQERGPATLRLVIAGGPRPKAIDEANLCVDIARESLPYPNGSRDALPWQSLGCHPIPPNVAELKLGMPGLLPKQPYLIRLSTKPWTPSSFPPDPGDPRRSDSRSLGVRWLAAAFIPE